MSKQMNLIEGPWIQLFDWLIESSICATLLLVALCVASYLFRSRSSSMRHAVWVTGIAGLLVLPPSLALLPRLRILPLSIHLGVQELVVANPAPPKFEAGASRSSFDAVGRHDQFEQSCADLQQQGVAESAVGDLDLVTHPDRSLTLNQRDPLEIHDIGSPAFYAAFALVWLAGSLVFTLRLIASYFWLHAIERTAVANRNSMVDDDFKLCALRLRLSPRVRLILSTQEIVPMAWGVIRPRVVLPELLVDCKSDDRRTILLHELGHVSRRDPLWHLLGELAGVVYWYHPLFWYARHQCAQMRENACDDLVLSAGVEPETYARCLLGFVSRRLVFPINLGPGVAMSMSSRIEERIRTVMCPSVDRSQIGKGIASSLAVGAMGCLIPLCMIRADNGPSGFSGESPTAVVALAQASEKSPASSMPMPVRDEPESKSEDNSIAKPVLHVSNIFSDEEVQVPTPSNEASDVLVEPNDENEATSNDYSQLTAKGRVLDSDGTPIPGALLIIDSYVKGEGRVSTPQRSNAEGEFSLNFNKEPNGTAIYVAWIHANGHAIRAVYLSPLFYQTDRVDDFEIWLPRVDPSSFQVLDPDGAPLAGALVVPSKVALHPVRLINGKTAIEESSGLSGSPPAEFVDLIGQRTNADGRVELMKVPRHSFNEVNVMMPGFGTQEFGVRTVPQSFQLAKTGEIRGRLLIDLPELVAGTEILVQSNIFGSPQGSSIVKLDKNAEFHIPAIAEGKGLFVSASWDETLEIHPVLPRRNRHNVAAGQVLDLVIQTCKAVKVNGQVLTSDTREPVVGARVSLNSLDSPINGVRALTSKEGRFTLRIVPGATLQQVTYLGEDRSLNERYDHPRLNHITIPDDVEKFDLEPYLLPAMETVSGRLQDSAGQSIDRAIVILQNISITKVMSRAVTDSNGRFTMGVKDWAVINGDANIAERYRWAILDDERTVSGLQEIKTTPVRVLKVNSNELLLVRPPG